ncbi:hypothetical protein BDV06DRAFT_222014 [Aspergillus oleicola]
MALDMKAFLSSRAAEKGECEEVVGDVRFVATLVRIVDFGQRETLIQLFERAYAGYKESIAAPGSHGRRYGPLPPTLATYMMGEMVRSPQAKEAMDLELQKHNKEELLRYKIKVVRDSFIWLDEMMTSRGDWVENLIPQLDGLVQNDATKRVRWLSEPRTEMFWEQASGAKPLTESEKVDLESLWGMFDGNDWMPIGAAFCLARLDFESHRSDSWARLSSVIWPLYLGA